MKTSSRPQPVWERRLFPAFLLLFVASVVAGTGYTMLRLRQSALTFHTELVATHARTFEVQLTQNLSVVDLLLSNLVDDVGLHLPAPRLGAMLKAEMARVPLVRSISVLNEQGSIVASSNPGNLGRSVLLDDFLPQVPAGSSAGALLRFGPPWVGRDFGDGYHTTATQPASLEDPTFIPVVRQLQVGTQRITLLVALNPDFLVNLFSKTLEADLQETANVVRYDGRLMLSTEAADAPGSVQHATAVADPDIENGTYSGPDDDGATTLTAFRASRLYPLMVVVHMDEAQALASWRNERRSLMLTVLPALAGVVLLSLYVYRRQRRSEAERSEAEQLQRQRLSAVLNALPAELVMLDDAGRIQMGNALWRQSQDTLGDGSAGDGTAELYLVRWERVYRLQPDVHTRLQQGVDAVLGAQATTFTMEYPAEAAGRSHWFQVMVHALREPGMSGAVVMQLDITGRKHAEAALVASQAQTAAQSQRLSEVIWGTNIGTWEWNVQTGETMFNERWAEICGYTLAELAPLTIDTWHRLVHPDDGRRSEAMLQRCFARETEFYACEVRMRHKGGHWVWVLDRGRVVQWSEDGHARRMAGTHQEITQRKEAEDRLRLAASVFTHAREGIVITDPQGTIVDVNDTFTRITGYTHDEAVGQNPRMLKSGRQLPQHYADMWASIHSKGHWMGEIWNRRKNGEVYAEMLAISAVRDDEARIKNYVALFTDITPMKEHQSQLERIAHYDPLTGLPNRVLFADRLEQALFQAERRKRALAVVYLDLDGFKGVNDHHGHSTGDELLIRLSQRMKLALREGDSMARVGGDEFVAVLVDLDEPQDCVPVLERLLLAASEPVSLEAGSGPVVLRVSASIGAAIYPRDGVQADLLLREADQSMYLAKQSGKNRYHLFDQAHDSAIRTQRERVDEIHRALVRGELELYFQPKYDLLQQSVVGAEALLRWNHPQRGVVAPGEFLPHVEGHPLSIALGEWVLHRAMQHMVRWQTQGVITPLSVNVGAMLLQKPGFADSLAGILAAYPTVPRGHLELEILESSALEDIALVAGVLQNCQSLGVQFALDDFGTGYSSLTYLKHLPAQTLKIDQSFVRDMLTDPDDLTIVQGVIGLAQAFGRMVIAEGVESAAHREQLLAMGCRYAQGYSIARPMPEAQFLAWLEEQPGSTRG